MNIENFTALPVIIVLCYFIGMAVKNLLPTDNKWIPVIVGSVGMVLGLIALYLKIDWMPAKDPFTAAVLGIVSGLSSTGAHQIVKQLNVKESQ